MSGQSPSKGVLFFVVIVLLGALLGGIFGEILGLIITDGIFNKLLVTGLSTAVNPVTVDLAVLHFTFGMGMQLNLLSVFGIIGAMWLFFKM